MDDKRDNPYKLQLGKWTVWSLCDGHLDIDQCTFFDVDPLVIKEEIEKENIACLRDFVVKTRVNMYLIKTENDLVLVDTGCGSSMGDGVGFLPDQLELLNYKMSDITHVIITHLHGDHMGGLLDSQGKMAFPKATVYVSEIESGFWRNSDNEAGFSGMILSFFEQARNVLAPYESAGKLKIIGSEKTILDGIEVVNAFGHTLGHLALHIQSSGQALLIWSDIVHNVYLQVKHPQWPVLVDVDQEEGIKSRQRLLERAADEKLLVGGGHVPSPGFGHVARKGDHFGWQSAS